MDWLLGQFPDLRMNIRELVADGDVVALRRARLPAALSHRLRRR